MTSPVNQDDFAPLLGQSFRIACAGHSENLTLVEISRLRSNPASRFRDGFSLFFDGESRTVMLGQSIYPLENDSLGTLELFLVPVGRLAGGNFRYQAVFG